MAEDFWDQFPLYESGGITGQPSVDPSQLQVGDPALQNSISLQNPAPTSPMLPGNGAPTTSHGSNSPPLGAFAGGVGNLANLGSSAFGGLFGIGGGPGGGMGVFQTIANKLQPSHAAMNPGGTVQMRTPSGQVIQVPMPHLQEALRRGAKQV